MNQYGILTGVSYALCLSILIHEFLWFINNVLRQYYTFSTVFSFELIPSLTQGHFRGLSIKKSDFWTILTFLGIKGLTRSLNGTNPLHFQPKSRVFAWVLT